jgi:ZIP family zinc transporter
MSRLDLPVQPESTRTEISVAPTDPGRRGLPLWFKGLAPLALLAALVIVFLQVGPLGVFRQSFPPVEELTVERIRLPQFGVMEVDVVNGGPEPVTIAQVMVDDANWVHQVDGGRTLDRLESRTITIPYPWVEGEPHTVALVTSTGLTFTGEVAVASQSPRADARYLTTFALLGIYAGVIPVFIGLLWLPFVRAVNRKWIDFFLSLTIGLLVFLGVSSLIESIETAGLVAAAFQGHALVLLGVLGTPLVLAAVGRWRAGGRRERSPLYVAGLIALGIGLHNLGEGLAIGTSYASGEIALGTFLVIGFLLHNTTEGLGIVSPLAQERPKTGSLILLGLLAGVPTVLGAWFGGFTYSPAWTTLFLAVGAGAIAQVVYELWRLFARRAEGSLTAPLNVAGLMIGMVIMYATGLFVPA